MISVDVKLDPVQLAEAERMLEGIRMGVPRAIHSAVKRAIEGQRPAGIIATIVRAIREDLNIRAGDLYRKGDYSRPVRSTFVRNGSHIAGGRVVVSGRRLPLSRFEPRQIKMGVSYKLRAGAARDRVPSGFITRVGAGGHQGVFVRRTKSGRMVGRLPIDELKGPSVPHVAENQPDVQQLLQGAGDELVRLGFDQEIARLLYAAADRGLVPRGAA